MRRLLAELRRKAVFLMYDRRYGIQTSRWVDLAELGLAQEERVRYIPSSWRALRRALRGYEIGSDDVFLDAGSGMGRMVVEASRYPFRRVVGVELASELHCVAERNISRSRRRARCGAIELVNSDIVDYEFPDDVTFVYMFNPFRGAIFRSAIGNLIQSIDRNPRAVRLLYVNPVEEPYLLGTKRFRVERLEHAPGHARIYCSIDPTNRG